MRERQRQRQREKQAPRREPEVGLDPGSPGSHPGLKATLNHPGCSVMFLLLLKILFIHERYRGRETQAEGEAGSMQRA